MEDSLMTLFAERFANGTTTLEEIEGTVRVVTDFGILNSVLSTPNVEVKSLTEIVISFVYTDQAAHDDMTELRRLYTEQYPLFDEVFHDAVKFVYQEELIAALEEFVGYAERDEVLGGAR